MNHTWKIIAIFLLDRNYVALIAHSDNRFLKVFLICCIMQDCRQAILHTYLRCMQFPRNPAQFRTGIITEISMRVDGILQMTFHHPEDLNRLCSLFENRHIQREITKKILHIPHPAHRTHDRAQFIDLEDRAHGCRLQYMPHVIDPTEGRCLHLQYLYRLCRLLMKPYDLIVISGRHDTAAAFFALHRSGKCCKPICDLLVFQNLERLSVHTYLYKMPRK